MNLVTFTRADILRKQHHKPLASVLVRSYEFSGDLTEDGPELELNIVKKCSGSEILWLIEGTGHAYRADIEDRTAKVFSRVFDVESCFILGPAGGSDRKSVV